MALAYDADGRIKSSNGLQITRDAAGRIASIVYAPGKVVSYTYDARGLLTTMTDWVGGATTFTYDDVGQLTGAVFPNGVSEDNTYDANGRVSAINITAGGASLSSIALQRDAAGQVTAADRSTPSVAGAASGNQEFAYDAAGQLSSAVYDTSGRLTSDGLRSYTWDLASRMLSYSGSDGGASFTYDALGQRISRTSGGATQSYALNYALGLPSVSIVRDDSGDQRYYVWMPSGILLYSIEASDNSRHFYHYDETGSTNFLTDDTGAVTDSYAITPYGETAIQTGSTDNPFTFQGEFGVMQEGATGLYYMRARYYDSAAARFLSRDPVGSLDPRSLNPYQYAAGNPVRFNDPTGLQPGFQPPGFTCIANAGTPVIVRVEGITELVGDLLLQCTGGQPQAGPATLSRANLYPFVPFTSRSVGGASPDALLLIDEPTSIADPVIRITNIRANANQLGAPAIPFVQPTFAPITTTPLPSLISNATAGQTPTIPRFIDSPSAARNLFVVNICRTNLLYPFVTNQPGFDTGLAISNTSTDPFGTAAQTGPCTLNFYGAGAPSASPTVASTPVFTYIPSAAGFQGYGFVTNFQYAHGFAFISDQGAQRLAGGYLGLVMDPPGETGR